MAAPEHSPHAARLTSEDIHRRVGERLIAGRVRYTGGRRLVVGALGAADGPVTVLELHERLEGRLPVSSLYRTVSVLETAGVLRRSHDGEGVARCELAEWLSGHHHHLVCVECGVTIDFEADAGIERRLTELAAAIGAQADFDVAGHSLDLEGRCRSCLMS